VDAGRKSPHEVEPGSGSTLLTAFHIRQARTRFRGCCTHGGTITLDQRVVGIAEVGLMLALVKT